MTDDLTTNYSKAYDGSLQPGARPALLLIDMVMAYVDPQSPLFCDTATAAAACAARLLGHARSSGWPVAHSCVSYEPGGADGGVFYRKVPVLRLFDRGSPLGAFVDGLDPQPDEHVVVKQYPSAFFATDLAPWLTSHGVDTLVIGGYSTSGCVRASVLDALQHGFIPFVVRDACADRHHAPHEANLFDIAAKYGEVIDEAAFQATFGR